MAKIFILNRIIKRKKELNMKSNKKLVAVLAVILVILIGVCVILFTKGDSDDAEKAGETVQQEEQQDETTDPEDVVSTVEQQIEEEEAYVIETDYCKLYYPAKWEANLQTEIKDEEGYVVEFYGAVEGKDKQPLFNIVFGQEADFVIGTIDKDGEAVEVGCTFMDPAVEEWNTEEADIIYAMQEDMNYLIGMIQREDGFTPAE